MARNHYSGFVKKVTYQMLLVYMYQRCASSN